MKSKDSRRIVPASAMAVFLLSILIAFEVLVISGAYRIKASTVARIVPWAYEPFLKLVGEDPAAMRVRHEVKGDDETPDGLAAVESFTGLGSGILVDEPITNLAEETVLEPTTPMELPTESNIPPAEVDEDIPVG